MKKIFLFLLLAISGFAQTIPNRKVDIGAIAPGQSEAFEERLKREGLPIGGASIAPYTTSISNTTIAGGSTTLFSFGPSPTEMLWVDNVVVSANEAFDGNFVQDNPLIQPSGVLRDIVPILMPATGGVQYPLQRKFIPEKSTVSVQSIAAQGSSTFKFRMGVSGTRVAKDFLKPARRVLLKIGDSISDGTRLTYGEESYDYKFMSWLEAQTNTTWREVSKAKASFRSDDIEGLRLTSSLWAKQADVILYNVGMNDITGNGVTTYDPILAKVLAEKQAYFPNAIMYVIGPTPSPAGGKPNLPGIRSAAQSRVSALNDSRIIYVDFGALWDASSSTDLATYTPNPDNVHPLPAGHVLMTNKLISATTTPILNLIKALP